MFSDDNNEIKETDAGENAVEAENPAINKEDSSIVNGNKVTQEETESVRI